MYISLLKFKKNYKIPNEQSKSVTQRRTDNTIAKQKRTKGQKMIHKATTKKTQDRAT